MALRAATTTGVFSSSAIWDQVTNTPSIHASNNITVNTTGVFSATFTAPNTTNAATGVLVHITSKGTATTLTATLQEATVDTAHTATITLANVDVGATNGWVYIRPATPYVFTAITAGRYRWKLTCDVNTMTVAQASTANFAYVSTDDRHSVPVDTEPVFIVPKNEDAGITVTVDGTQACGSTTGAGALRSITNAITLDQGSTLKADVAASTTITCRGGIYVATGCEFQVGTVAVPYPSSFVARFNLITSSVTVPDGAKLTLQGSPLTNWKSTYVSGLGTAASPMITAGDIGVVGDEVLIGAASDDAANYDQTESRFIITKNSATSYVVSTTSGGAEAALTYTHSAGADIVNVQRNVIIAGTSEATGMYIAANAQSVAGFYEVKWVRFDNVLNGSFLGVGITYIEIPTNASIDYCVAYGGLIGQYRFNAVSTTKTFTGLIGYSTGGIAAGQADSSNFIMVNCSNLTFNDFFSMGHDSIGYSIGSSYANMFNRCKAYAGGMAGGTATAGFYISSSGQNTFTDCEAHSCRLRGVYLTGSVGNVFNGGNLGTLGENKTADITTASSTYNDTLFDSVTFGSPTLISNYLNQLLGSEVAFHRKNNTDNNHEWYNVNGRAFAEGTIVRSPGLAVGIQAENATRGFTWQFQIPVTQNSLGRFFGWFLKDATLNTDDVTISMYLPGNPVSGGVPSASAVLDDTTGASWSDANEQFASLVADYDGDTPGVAEVLVNVKSTSGGILYADDFFNAGDRTTTFDQITGLNTWVNGKPIGVIQPSVPSAIDTAQAVWDYLKADATVTGTMGVALKEAADNAELAAIKP